MNFCMDKWGKKFKNIVFCVFLAQFFWLIFLLFFSIKMQVLIQENIAREIFSYVRRSILKGDLRTAMLDLHSSLNRNLNSFCYQNSRGKVLFSLPQNRKRISCLEDFLNERWLEKFLFTLDNSLSHQETNKSLLVARYNPYSYLLIAFNIWFVSLLLSIPAFFSMKKFYRKKYQDEKVFERNRAIALTGQMLAHDLRKPFQNIRMLIELIVKQKELSKIKKIVQNYKPYFFRSLISIEQVFDEVLAIGRDKQNLKIELSSVRLLLYKSFKDCLKSFAHAKVQISKNFTNKSFIKVDQEKILRVFYNIIFNALNSIQENNKNIFFETKNYVHQEKSMVLVVIANLGSYIATSDQKKIFEPFFTKSNPEGSGLGLAVCQRYVEAHGGKIWCQSTRQEGTKFFILLPSL